MSTCLSELWILAVRMYFDRLLPSALQVSERGLFHGGEGGGGEAHGSHLGLGNPMSCLPFIRSGTSLVFKDRTGIVSLLPFHFGVNAAASSARLSCVCVSKILYEFRS